MIKIMNQDSMALAKHGKIDMVMVKCQGNSE